MPRYFLDCRTLATWDLAWNNGVANNPNSTIETSSSALAAAIWRLWTIGGRFFDIPEKPSLPPGMPVIPDNIWLPLRSIYYEQRTTSAISYDLRMVLRVWNAFPHCLPRVGEFDRADCMTNTATLRCEICPGRINQSRWNNVDGGRHVAVRNWVFGVRPPVEARPSDILCLYADYWLSIDLFPTPGPAAPNGWITAIDDTRDIDYGLALEDCVNAWRMGNARPFMVWDAKRNMNSPILEKKSAP